MNNRLEIHANSGIIVPMGPLKRLLNSWRPLSANAIASTVVADSLKQQNLQFDDLQTRRALNSIFSSFGVDIARFPFPAFEWQIELQRLPQHTVLKKLSPELTGETSAQLLDEEETARDIEKVQKGLKFFKLRSNLCFSIAIPSALFFSSIYMFQGSGLYHVVQKFPLPLSFALHSAVTGALGWGRFYALSKPQTFYAKNTRKLMVAAGQLLTRTWVKEAKIAKFHEPVFCCDARKLPDSYLNLFGLAKPENATSEPVALTFKSYDLFTKLMLIFAAQRHPFEVEIKPNNPKLGKLKVIIAARPRLSPACFP